MAYLFIFILAAMVHGQKNNNVEFAAVGDGAVASLEKITLGSHPDLEYYYDEDDFDYIPIYEEDGEEYKEYEELFEQLIFESTVFEMVSLHEDIEAMITFNRLGSEACEIDATVHTRSGDLFFDETGELHPTESLPTLYLVDGREDCLSLVGEKGNVSVKFIGAFRGPGVVVADMTARVQYHELNNRCIAIMRRSVGDKKDSKRKTRRRNKKKGQRKKNGNGSDSAGTTGILDPRIPSQFRSNPFVTIRLDHFELLSVSIPSKSVTEPTTTEKPATVNVPNKACDKDPNDHLADENDCSAFLHCLHQEYVVKYCGPGTLFNPQKKICDHPEEVYKIKPQCQTP